MSISPTGKPFANPQGRDVAHKPRRLPSRVRLIDIMAAARYISSSSYRGSRRGGGAGVVAIFAGRLLAGEACTVYGDGTQTRDFVYVDDVVDAFVRSIDRAGGLLLNIGSGEETSVRDLYDLMASRAGVEAPPNHEPARAGELARSALDPGLARRELGWEPATSLADGVDGVLAWFGSRT